MLRGNTQKEWGGPASENRRRFATVADVLRGAPEFAGKAGVYIMDARGSQEFRTYTQILENALRVGASLRIQGIGRLERVMLLQSTGFDFMSAFFGAVAIGATPVPYPPPGRQDHANGEPRFMKTAKRLGASAIVADTDIDIAKLSAMGPAGTVSSVHTVPSLLEGMPVGAVVEPHTSLPEIAYIQLTSGATGPMRGVELTHRNILSNTRAIGRALEVREDDIGVSWIPPYNSMGLVGLICFGLYWGIDLVLIHPERFLKRPEEWLAAISRHRGTLSTAPNFAYHYAVRRCQESNLEGLDLSSWRVAMSGAEPVRAQHMDAFVRRFSNYGLRRDVFLPVYGLAEATVGVTFAELNKPFGIDGINRRVLEKEGRAEPLPEEGAKSPAERLHLVSVGKPLEEIDVKIVGDDGQELDDRHCGEICVRGPNVMKGYTADKPSRRVDSPGCTRLQGEWLMTGDLGYIAEGELYVLGRVCDAIETARERLVFPEEIELFVNSVDGIRAGSAVAFSVTASADAEGAEPNLLVIAYELQAGTEASDVERAVKSLIRKHLSIDPHALVALSPGSVPKTHSGKVRRFLARRLYLEDRLERRQRTAGELEGVRRFVQRAQTEASRLRNTFLQRLDNWLSK
ncbi:fatty acyl-AMP ligase [Persicimonas caeni]|uniref:Fatty acyl-AMP ligase n=1 Tax=Persicimonas caeni TaxID=2292766 RepID=A0A4Y6PYJ1_PERCE|nr:AMP-binding protein [Persicimonas caeni]QDG53398.1 fatty acyl-AMP ligase [Persicimonas caeni]QED34619.1 fatty acyl-AMP ligase [Persicimonas caeni]